MTPASFLNMLLVYADKLKFRNLFLVVLGLFVADVIIPDFIPLIDEILLGLLAILLASWKAERKEGNKDGNLIEGEIVDEEDK